MGGFDVPLRAGPRGHRSSVRPSSSSPVGPEGPGGAVPCPSSLAWPGLGCGYLCRWRGTSRKLASLVWGSMSVLNIGSVFTAKPVSFWVDSLGIPEGPELSHAIGVAFVLCPCFMCVCLANLIESKVISF